MGLAIESTVKTTFDRAALDRLFKARNGPIILHIANAGRELLAACIREAPRSDGLSGSGAVKEGVRLADSGEFNMVKVNGQWTAEIKFTAEHAAAIVKGADSHVIPQSGSGHLYFFWEREQRYFGAPFPNAVTHPGNKPNDFITRAAQKKGFRVTKPAASA